MKRIFESTGRTIRRISFFDIYPLYTLRSLIDSSGKKGGGKNDAIIPRERMIGIEISPKGGAFRGNFRGNFPAFPGGKATLNFIG